MAVRPDQIIVSATTPRGVMRGVYWLEDMMRLRSGPFVAQGNADRNCCFRRRLNARRAHLQDRVRGELAPADL